MRKRAVRNKTTEQSQTQELPAFLALARGERAGIGVEKPKCLQEQLLSSRGSSAQTG